MTRHVKTECFRDNALPILSTLKVPPTMIINAIEHCYKTLDIIDEQLQNNNSPRLANLVELANLSSIVGNLLGAGCEMYSNGTFIRNKPHTFPDLIPVSGEGEGLEIKIALETNKPKGHLPKAGYYLTFRYVLTDAEGQYVKGKDTRGDVVSIWEAKFGYLEETDFAISNTEGDSGKTAVIKTDAHNEMKLVYFDGSLVPYKHSESKPYPGYN